MSGESESEERLKECPRAGHLAWFNPETGEVRPARCKANFCGWCGPVNAWQVAGAIGLARPERLATFTHVGRDFQTVRGRYRRAVYLLRQRGFEWDACWHVEPNPSSDEQHLHTFQRGSYVPQDQLVDVADRCGMGRIVDIRAFEVPEGKAVSYGVKLAGVPYGLKLAEQEATMAGYLRANGGRMVHATRGFWRDEHGQVVGQREAMQAWLRVRSGDVEDQLEAWQLVPRSDLSRVAG